MQVLQSNKALPPPVKDNLPPTPPQDQPHSFSSAPPHPPSKFNTHHESSPHPNGLRPLPAPIDIAPPDELLGQDLNPHSGPVTPSSPASPASPDPRARRSNPLVDLIDTEKLYVEQLTGVIRKVASAWSRSNLPPHDLDLMFRSIESVYKADRSLLSRLKEIGTTPSSPKALGDLLMRWINELEEPYTSYCERYCTGFDTWEPVRNNTRLPGVLATFSANLPPPSASSDNQDSQIWTLDELFLLPMGRLKYFKKLYGRLLKGAQPGRSDYKHLVDAAEKLDKLLATLDARAMIKAGSPAAAPEVEDEVVVDLRSPTEVSKTRELPSVETTTGSETSSARGSSLSSAARSSNDTSLSSVERGPAGDLLIPLPDLESRLAAERCLDIFTMKSRPVRLQISPPSLPYVRSLRIGADVAVRFVPRSTGVEVNHPGGRVFILSDLFLLCEQMAPGEKSTESPAADMWLLYPPLAGKHLKVAKAENEDRALQVTVLRKEKLVLVFSSPAIRERAFSELTECIEFASAVHTSSKHPLPPMPTLNGMPKSQPAPGGGMPSSQTAPDLRQSNAPPMSSRSPSPHRVSSPVSSLGHSLSRHDSGPSPRNSHDTTPASMSLTSSMSNLVHSLETQIQQGGSWAQPVHHPHPTPPYPVRQQSQPEGLDNSVGQPRFAGGLPLGPSQPPLLQPVAPVPRAGPAPGEVVSPGQFLPTQRAASAGPLGRRGPLGLAHAQQPMPGMDPSITQRAPPRLPPNPVNGQLMPPNAPIVPPGREPLDPSFQGGLRKSHPPHASIHYPNQGGPPHSTERRIQEWQVALICCFHVRIPRDRLASRNFASFHRLHNSVRHRWSSDEVQGLFKQGHAQWKSLGSAKLKLFHEQPTNVKQLVVEAEDKNKSVLISTIVLTDGVERVGKTGVAVELSDNGARTGIIYMIQLRNEQAAVGLYESLLAGSDRTVAR
ncbi:hypothetical protein BJV77DRAFT_1153393 [Russula vinacea]|nr:hypothetical protein BJV77DRAFT_1153393 [Russula vinacea]